MVAVAVYDDAVSCLSAAGNGTAASFCPGAICAFVTPTAFWVLFVALTTWLVATAYVVQRPRAVGSAVSSPKRTYTYFLALSLAYSGVTMILLFIAKGGVASSTSLFAAIANIYAVWLAGTCLLTEVCA